MQRNPRTEFRVGVFVVAAIIVGGAIAFSLGGQRGLFADEDVFYAKFPDVGGLRSGSPVHIGGVNVGQVDAVTFADDGQIKVALEISEGAREFMREGSVASLSNKGMLGDKLVEIRAGEGDKLEPGSVIPADQAASLSDYLDKAGRLLAGAQATVDNLRQATEPLSTPEFQQNVADTARNIAKVSEMAAEGSGPLQRMMTDQELARQTASAIRNLEAASAGLAATSRDVQSISREIRSGDGTAHELIYGTDGKRMIGSLADAATEIASLTGDIREGDGTLHELVYGREGDSLVANLTQVSEDLKVITGDVRAGRGTVGALLRDPSVYEDIKRLVGDLRRNEILRSLVRYSIRRDERVEPVEVEPADTQ
jgi:phospholipid/cholesterol/gamma-HCH transport system substrate-binding protein